MTQLAQHPSYLRIEDQLDSVAQKYRIWRFVRGAMLWGCSTATSAFAAAMAAHWCGASTWTSVIFISWLVWVAAALVFWLLRPLVQRPRVAEVARLVERRLDGLHNGLTNSVLLARADDLQKSPWLPVIFDEVLAAIKGKSLGQAVRLTDLRPLALRTAGIVAALVLLLLVPGIRSALGHGWRQMLHPSAFVPRVGNVQIIEIQPRNITLVSGQPLEVTVLARDSAGGMPQGQLIFEGHRAAQAAMPPAMADEQTLRYSYRVEHVEQPMRYRVEVGGTQSEWFAVKVVRQVKLTGLSLHLTPPGYTNQPHKTVALKPQDIGKQILSAPEGSRVELSAEIDVPTGGALMQIQDEEPTPMERAAGGQRFTGRFALLRDAQAGVLLKEAEQIIARLPEQPLVLQCLKDSPPSIEMKWPTQDVSVPPEQPIRLRAVVRDDYGVGAVRILASLAPDQPLSVRHEKKIGQAAAEVTYELEVPAELRKHGRSIRVQLEASDNRLIAASPAHGSAASTGRDLGPQVTQTSIYEISFRDAREIARIEKEAADKLREILRQLLQKQSSLHEQTTAWKADKAAMGRIGAGQTELRQSMIQTAQNFPFDQEHKIIQKGLLMLALNPAREAADLSAAITAELVAREQVRLGGELQSRQRRIIHTLQSLLAMLNVSPDPTTMPTTRRGGDLPPDQREAYKKLKEDLDKFIKEEQRILDQSAHLAKKPVDNFDDKDKKLLEELTLAQEKMDAFMQEKVSDFSKLAEQDMANASLLKELMEVFSEVTMAKDALKQKAVEIAVPLEESGLELAKEISSNLEKWLMDTPDRAKWTMEEPLKKQDVPMAELPKELEDMVGELLEAQEDLLEEAEDAASSWADSMDKGAGWDAMDGPISNMTAKGVTGNQLPNDMEIGGRSGEGRSGKSSGEMVEETASGKGGRNTPTRLDPTPFQKGQIKDEGKDPTGGATGGGKMSGQGGRGLEGPVAPKDLQEQMKRLSAKQAELRNKAERLNLQKQISKYDQFKLLESIAIMRRLESDFRANRYDTAMRRKDVVLDRLDESRLLLGAQIHVKHDTSPTASQKVQDQINDAMRGKLPDAWSEPLKEYYKRLAKE